MTAIALKGIQKILRYLSKIINIHVKKVKRNKTSDIFLALFENRLYRVLF